jgi:hypothetical protein
LFRARSPAPIIAPFATSVRTGVELTIAAEVDALESQLSDLLKQKEMVRPGGWQRASMRTEVSQFACQTRVSHFASALFFLLLFLLSWKWR